MFGAAFFGNGLNAGGAIQGGKLDKAGIDRLYKDIDDRHRGVGKAHRPLYLDGGMEYVKTQTTPNDAQFIEAAQHQVEEICRWFGVPPQKVGHLLRMTFNNVEQLSIEVVVDSITPWAIRFEEEANFKLFGQNRGGFFVKLDLKGLLRGAFKDRQEGLQVMRRNGAINADEWRELEDMGPMKGTKGGAKYIVEANMTTLDKVGEEPPKPPPAPAPAAPPPPPAPPTARAARPCAETGPGRKRRRDRPARPARRIRCAWPGRSRRHPGPGRQGRHQRHCRAHRQRRPAAARAQLRTRA
jgi:hypothetical protein